MDQRLATLLFSLLSPPLLDADTLPAPPIVVIFRLPSRGQAKTPVSENSPSLAAPPPTRPLFLYSLGIAVQCFSL